MQNPHFLKDTKFIVKFTNLQIFLSLPVVCAQSAFSGSKTVCLTQLV
jgi:hypothetical protein